MKSLIFVLLFTASVSVKAQNAPPEKKAVPPAKKTVVKTTPLPADDKDPVCFMKVKKGSLMTVLYKEKLYGFCSEHCKAVFLADPAAQLK